MIAGDDCGGRSKSPPGKRSPLRRRDENGEAFQGRHSSPLEEGGRVPRFGNIGPQSGVYFIVKEGPGSWSFFTNTRSTGWAKNGSSSGSLFPCSWRDSSRWW